MKRIGDVALTAAERSRRWREANPGKSAAKQRAYRERHPGRSAAHSKKWRDSIPYDERREQERTYERQRESRPEVRERRARQARERRAQNPEREKQLNAKYRDKKRDWRMRRDYGITRAEFEAAKEKQGGLCAICRRPQSKRGHDLHIDHDHSTGKFRALLCDPCNVGLGFFADDMERLAAAIEYLRTHRA